MNQLKNGATNQEFSEATHQQLEVARAVIDALLEHDLLGALLSPKHLRMAMLHLPMAEQHTLAARAIALDHQGFEAFHQWMLKLYCGMFIAEYRLRSKYELQRELDAKCEFIASSADGDSRPNEEHDRHVELIWRYRRSCSEILVSHR